MIGFGNPLTDAFQYGFPSQGTPVPHVIDTGFMQLNGLWHLNGQTVTVFAGGLDVGDYSVVSGSLTVPYGAAMGIFTRTFAAAANYVVGFTYNSDGQLVRPMEAAIAGSRTGPALGKVRRVKQVSIFMNNQSMSNTPGQSTLQVGTSFTTMLPALINFGTTRKPDPGTLATFDGVWMDTVRDEAAYDSMICWRISRPVPGNIPAIEGFINTEDR